MTNFDEGVNPLEVPSDYILQSQNTADALVIHGVSTLPELFKWQAERRSSATLFSFRSEPGAALTTLSYAEAYEISSQAAKSLYSLRQNSSNGNPVVGIWLEKSIDLHLAILATTISGATWLPFDADAPAARVTVCLEDSNAYILVCDSAHYESALKATENIAGCRLVTFEELSRLNNEATTELPGPCADDSAYMIYTSGSTGTPKGIEIPHSAALAFCLSERSVLETGPNDVVWQGFSAAFDMFIEEVWVSIAGGAHLAIGSRLECQDVPSLGGSEGIWAQRSVTLINAVPTLINIMTSLDSECRLPALVRLLNLGGEACPPALVKRLWNPSLRIINTYGPSETTVTATFQELFPDEQVTIGKPLPLYHAILLPVLDDTQKTWCPSPILLREGAEGELAIGGQCLGKGYVKRPELTKEKFIDHPLPSSRGERLYRTGDLVRLDKNLNIVFLGRIDTQVKHRGFRIELGEIEQAIAAHPRVQTAAVILSKTTDRLEAYVVDKDGETIEIRELRDSLRLLPAYMQPESFYFISANEMPRLPSGKINAKALQDLSIEFASQQKEALNDDQMSNASTAIPDDGSDLSIILRAMATIFPQASNITPTSDFFDDLGGHSLAAAMLVSKLRKDSTEGSALKGLGLQAIYIHRNAGSIAASISSVSDDGSSTGEKNKPLNSHMDDHWPVSRYKYILCSLAQIPALLFLFFIEAVTVLGPYIVFYIVLQDLSIGASVLGTYFTFVLIPPVRALIGIIGKWISLGKAKPGEYPLYGLYYYRWWLAEHFVALVDLISISDTPLLPSMMRLMGARVGNHCHIGVTYASCAFDLITIGDDVNMGKDTVLATSWIERGRLILAPVSIGSEAHVGSNSVLEGGSRIEDGGELGPLSMLSQGARVPAAERWTGSPATFEANSPDVGGMRASRPSEIRALALSLLLALTSLLILPIIIFAPQIPSLILFDYAIIRGEGMYVQTAIVAIPAGIGYMLLVFIELIVLRWLVLGKVVECSFHLTSFYFFRRWFVGRLMDISLVILRPLYASLYVVPFLRSLGVKIGRMAEVSTARGINFELTEIGDESFVADLVLIGDEHVHRNMVTLKKTKLDKRAFLGNASLVPQGTEMASNTLVGVLSTPPKTPLKEGQSCFGSPPVLMPARQRGLVDHADNLLYSPSRKMIALRLFIECLRIFVPRIIITFGLGFGLQVFETSYHAIGIWPNVLLLPIFYICFFGLPALVITVLFKWILIGRYSRAEWPLWSVNVWLSEFVTSVYEALAAPFFTDMLTGTPYLGWVFRLFGVQIGSRTTLLSNDITEFDMVSLGDEAVINRHAGPQTHLFEDRVMKVGRVDIEDHACMKAYSICLPNSRVGTYGQVGSLSLVMKGETVPAHEAWEGAPIAPRRSQNRSSRKASGDTLVSHTK